MTDEELEKKAKAYREGRKDLQYFSEPYKKKIEAAYIAGARENAPIWHYPAKGDFPNEGNAVVCCLLHDSKLLNTHEFCIATLNYRYDDDLDRNVFTDGDEVYEPFAWQYFEPPEEL